MRAIFIFLLLSNIVFFGYQYLSKTGGSSSSKSNSAVKQSAPVGVGELQFLTERAEDGGAFQRTTERKADNVSNKKAEAEFCTMIGPYEQLLQAEYALEYLASLEVEAHITPIEIKEGELYWVYLPPEVSEREALRRLYELQGKGVESHVITKGELTNGISFGRFGSYAQAEIRSREIKNLGYRVDIKMLPKIIQETWLVIDPEFGEKIDDTVWAALLSKEDSLEKRQNFCLGVDSL